MIQGTYLQIPSPADRGTTFCPAISSNFASLDTHSHNGLDSPLISAKSLAKGTINILSTSWIACGENEFSQIVTMPSGYLFDSSIIRFIISSGDFVGCEVSLSPKKISTNSFEVYTSFPNLNLKVILG